jgi:hypothetical protein
MMTRNWEASDCGHERIDEFLGVLGETAISAYLHPLQVLDGCKGARWKVVHSKELLECPNRQ